MSTSVPEFCSTPALQAAKNRLENDTRYEHHVGSWACTMLKNVFAGNDWVITPEKRDQKKKDRTLQWRNWIPADQKNLCMSIL